METSEFIKVVVWFILFIPTITLGLGMISAPSDIEVLIGFLVCVIAVVITIKTRCLTLISLKKKHEK